VEPALENRNTGRLDSDTQRGLHPPIIPPHPFQS
jgi:hypothetical protein